MEHRKTSSGTVQELRAVFAKSQLTGTLGSSQESTLSFMDSSNRVDPLNKDLDSIDSEAQSSSNNVSCKQPGMKPFIGPKPTVGGQGTKPGIKNLVASLEGSHGMYTSKNLHGKRAITVRDLRENSENNKPTGKDSQVKSTLIKKERVILCDSRKQSTTSVDEIDTSSTHRSPCEQEVAVLKDDIVSHSMEGISAAHPAHKICDNQESTDRPLEIEAFEACRSDKKLDSVISADNYVCKRQVVYVRRSPPSRESLGPAPPKPPRSEGMRLPFQERTHFSADNSSGSSCSSSGDSLPPPPVPDRNPNAFIRPPSRVPPKPPRSPPKPHAKTGPAENIPCGPTLSPGGALVTEEEEEEEIYNDIILTIEPATPPNLPLPVDDEDDLYDDHENFPPSLPKCPPPSPPGAEHPSSQTELQQQKNLLLTASGSSYNQDSSENEDTENIYEEAPLGPEYVNSEDLNKGKKKIKKKKLKLEQKNLEKIERKRDKFMKMFTLTGEEIPLDAGFVKSDSKGSKYDLNVLKGETVLILRMENNPSGKWLAKNGKGRIGYVELTNIQVDVESVKSVMTVRASQIYGEDVISVPQKEIAEADETNTF